MDNWNDGQCMSFVLDKTKKKRRCGNKCKNNDFCSKHIQKKQYYDQLLENIKINTIKDLNINIEKINIDINKKNIENTENETANEIAKIITNIKNRVNFLNNNYNYTLMYMYDSWSEIDFSHQILIDNEYWHIDILINNITQQLNNSTMENPYPTYPNNPFNRIPVTPNSILKIKQRITVLQKQIHIGLKLFLSQSNESLDEMYNAALNSNDLFSPQILALFNKNLRFMIINSKNSQDSYIGIWVHQKYPMTNFEILYTHFKNMPYQIMHHGYVINNPQRAFFSNKLASIREDQIGINNKKFFELL